MVTDIAYISDGTPFHYLSIIQELFNNEIVAWQLSDRSGQEKETSRKPFSIRIRAPIDVSGIQHTIKVGVKGSHSRKATCLENACLKSFFSHLKTEKLYLIQGNSGAEIRQAVEGYIYHNSRRFQAKLKHVST